MMKDQSFTRSFLVDQSPDTAIAAVGNVRGWWSEGIVGHANHVGDRFTHSVLDLHRCEIEVTDLVPGKKVVWTVLDNWFSFTEDKAEWIGTTMVFEVTQRGKQTELRLTHVGLVPEYECYEVCQDGWTTYLESLRQLIATGRGAPNVGEAKTDSEVALSRR
jgi:uncharacterized protein YndB with AHSA1/START domain